jgi:hypothetical protein
MSGTSGRAGIFVDLSARPDANILGKAVTTSERNEKPGSTFAWRRPPLERESLCLSQPRAGRPASTPSGMVNQTSARFYHRDRSGARSRRPRMADLCCGNMDQYSGDWLAKRTEALLGSNLGRNSQPDGASMDATRPRQTRNGSCRGPVFARGCLLRFRLRPGVPRKHPVTHFHCTRPRSGTLAPIEHRSHAWENPVGTMPTLLARRPSRPTTFPLAVSSDAPSRSPTDSSSLS